MPWSFLFVIGLGQGLFLIFVLTARDHDNRLATRLLRFLLVLFVLANFDDLLLATGCYRAVPWLFGLSMGVFFAYGPLFYNYVLAVTNPSFRWQRASWGHFAPALLYFLLDLPFLLLPASVKIRLLDDFLAGALRMRPVDAALAIVQILHFCLYTWMTFRALRKVRTTPVSGNYQVPMLQRAAWLYRLTVLYSMIGLALTGLFVWNIACGYYASKANFVFTLFTSAILYFIAYKMMVGPGLVAPGFSKKYQAVYIDDTEAQEIEMRLKQTLEEEKAFTDPELSLNSLAAQLNIAPNRLSMLINAKFGMSFSDYINQYRVEAFLARLNDPRFAHYTLHGLALEVGFNSKSAFNAAFKKITGKTPSDFKR